MLNEMAKNLYIEPYYHRLNVAGAPHPTHVANGPRVKTDSPGSSRCSLPEFIPLLENFI